MFAVGRKLKLRGDLCVAGEFGIEDLVASLAISHDEVHVAEEYPVQERRLVDVGSVTLESRGGELDHRGRFRHPIR